jgi:hypothetical protein
VPIGSKNALFFVTTSPDVLRIVNHPEGFSYGTVERSTLPFPGVHQAFSVQAAVEDIHGQDPIRTNVTIRNI